MLLLRQINIFRDPRWGRGQETPGEDPYLSSEYVFYLITGYQQGEDARYYKVVADCKHYAGYDVEDWHGNDRYGYNALISNQDLVETYLPSFKSCMKDAKVGSAMCSYNAVNGVPACANNFLMNEIARFRWGWEGWITSDCGAVSGIVDGHHYVQTHSEQVQVALRGGCDIGCDSALAQYGEQAYNDGSITDRDLDIALMRQFASLIRLGYFDPAASQPYRKYGWDRVNTQMAQTIAHQAALESMVLLKNDGLLPLSSLSGKTVAVIGPHGNNPGVQLGNYNGKPCSVSTPSTALTQLGVTVVTSKGCDVNTTDRSGFDDAVKAAKGADYILYVGGIDQSIESEGHDRNTIDLPGQQLDLIKALEAVGKPLAVVLMGGGGVDISYLKGSKTTNAILWAGYPSQAGGVAIAAVLTGQYSPAGRLPVTWYPASYVDSVPMTDQSMRASDSNPGRTYKFFTGDAVYPFGHGLTYTTWRYEVIDAVRPAYELSSLIANAVLDDRKADIALTVNVTNTGSVASSLSALAFVNSSASFTGITPPIRELFDYARVWRIAPGETVQLVFGLSYRVLSHVDASGHSWLLPGSYDIHINNERDAVNSFELRGEPLLVEDWPAPNNPPPVTPVSLQLNKHQRGPHAQ